MDKKAFPSHQARSLGSQFGSAVQGAALTAGATAAVAGIGVGIRELYQAATKHRDFRGMLEANPDLADMHAQDPKKMNRFFTSLRNMNPAFSQDPVVAGSYMRQMVESQQPGGIAMQAAQFRDSFKSPVMDAFMHGAGEGAKGFAVEGLKERGQNRRLGVQLQADRVNQSKQRSFMGSENAKGRDFTAGQDEKQRSFMGSENMKRQDFNVAAADLQHDRAIQLSELKNLHGTIPRDVGHSIGERASLLEQMRRAVRP